jgi:D-3-phosphoglycerate dehydrogenase
MKCVLLGDAIVTSTSMLRILKRLETRGIEFSLVDWMPGIAPVVFIRHVQQIESTGPIDLDSETLRVIGDAEIIVTNFAPVSAHTIMKGSKLRLIACTRGGTENIDKKAASARGVAVVNAPGRNATAVADFTLGLVLALHRRIAQVHCMMKQCVWDDRWSTPEQLSTDLRGKTIGIIGYGKVGRKVATRARGFEMTVLVYDPYADVDDGVVTAVDLETLLRDSDFVSIHARLTPETKNLIGTRELAMMKSTAYLINTARSGIVDEEALVDVLEMKRIQGAALDVFLEEPISRNHPLKKLDNVVLTPHLAGSTVEAELVNGIEIVGKEIERMLDSSTFINLV